MQRTSWDKNLFTGGRAHDLPADFKLYVTLKNHHKFVDGVGVVLPHLAGRIGPNVTTEASGAPVGSYGIDVHGTFQSAHGMRKHQT